VCPGIFVLFTIASPQPGSGVIMRMNCCSTMHAGDDGGSIERDVIGKPQQHESGIELVDE